MLKKCRNNWRSLLLVSIPIIVLIASFAWIVSNWYVEQRLGGGYALEYISSNNSRIFYGGKYVVVEAPVKSCGYDRRWIVVKTNGGQYYIIDKSIPFSPDSIDSIVTGPLDSSSFYTQKSYRQIMIGLRTIKQDDR